MRRLMMRWWTFSAYTAGSFAVALSLWVDRSFGKPDIEQILYHLQFAEGAAVQMSAAFQLTFLVEVIGLSLAAAGVATAVHAALAGRLPGRPARLLWLAPQGVVGAGLVALSLQFSAFSYAAALFGEDRFAGAYVDPDSITIRETARRNLILIYVESLEEAYGDVSLFGADLLVPLRPLPGERLSAYRQVPGATWTIAAMVATQCGIPLSAYSESDVRSGSDRRVFLPGATCLGDILKKRGYQNVFLGGAPLSFAGKGAFLRDHGYDTRFGREEWLAAGARGPGSPAPELGGWGLYDEVLYERARRQLAQLHASGKPFNLTLLTLDTHNPEGYPSPRCRRGLDQQDAKGAFRQLIRCNAELLAEFVRHLRDEGYLDNTVLVILGDHQAVGNPLDAELRSVTPRNLFNLFVGAPALPASEEPTVSFDLFPTLLEASGMRVEGGRLGLGRSVWHPDVLPSAWTKHPNLPALSASPVYRDLWSPSRSGG